MVPLLVISSNISDDIAKAAETKCIENPIKKTRYISVKIKIIDFAYVLSILFMITSKLGITKEKILKNNIFFNAAFFIPFL